jgi:hypothetical protein
MYRYFNVSRETLERETKRIINETHPWENNGSCSCGTTLDNCGLCPKCDY